MNSMLLMYGPILSHVYEGKWFSHGWGGRLLIQYPDATPAA